MVFVSVRYDTVGLGPESLKDAKPEEIPTKPIDAEPELTELVPSR